MWPDVPYALHLQYLNTYTADNSAMMTSKGIAFNAIIGVRVVFCTKKTDSMGLGSSESSKRIDSFVVFEVNIGRGYSFVGALLLGSSSLSPL